MKRTLILLLAVLITVLTVTVASADVVFQTYRYQFSLPDDWRCVEAGDAYMKCVREENGAISATVEVFEPRFASWQDTPDQLADMVKKQMGCSEDAGWEEIAVGDKKTILVDVQNYNGANAYISILGSGKHVFCVLYTAEILNKDDFIEILETVNARPADEIGFYDFGNANVKFVQFRTKELSGKKRLLLDFTWRNIGETISTFDSNVQVSVFQDGIELYESLVTVSATDTGTRIMPDKELDCTKVYDLRSQTGEIIVFIDKLQNDENKYAERQFTFNIH